VVVVHFGKVEQTSSDGGDGQSKASVSTDAALLLGALTGHRAAGTSLGGASGRLRSVCVGLGDVSELRLGGQVGADDLLVDDVLHERLHVHARRLDGLEHLLVGGSHGVHIVHDGLVGHQRQAQDLHATVLGGDHLGDSRHAHGIAADGAKELALGLGLVARAGDEAVGAVGSDLVVKLHSLGSVQHHVLELHIISISDGGESRTKSVVVDSSQRVVARDSGLLQGMSSIRVIEVQWCGKLNPAQNELTRPKWS